MRQGPMEQIRQQVHTASGIEVAGAVVAVAGMAATQDHAVSAFFKGSQNKHRVHTAGAGNTDDLYVCGVGQTAAAG